MAEVTGLRSNALNYPAYAAPYGVTFPILDADGDLVTGAAGLDSEISKNGDTFADCTNEATEIATASGMYYLLLTAAELTTDTATIIVKTSTSGAKTTPIVLYPRKLVTLRSGTAAGGAAGSITLDSGASAVDDAYNGCLVVGTLDSTVEARIITDYAGSTKVASVTPDWVTTPDSDDTFIIYIPEGMQMPFADLRAIGGLGVDGNNATLKLKQLDITNSGGTAVVMASTGSNGKGLDASGNGTGAGIKATGGGGSGGYGIHGVAAGRDGIVGQSTSGNANGIGGYGFGAGAGLYVLGGATGYGLNAVGGATSGAGMKVESTIAGQDALVCAGGAGGLDINAPDTNIGGVTVNGLAAGVITAAAVATGAIDADALATDAVAEIADGVWDEAIAGHLGAGSTGAALNSAGSAGDPWGTALPGAYSSGTAGHIVGTALPDIAPGSANGLLRGGTNAATSIATALTANVIGNITGNLSGSVGSVTAGVTVTTNNDKTGYGLADDAITAGKFDESTAFPVKSADAGSTQIARVGADGDTLETLSDQIDLTATAASIAALNNLSSAQAQTAATAALNAYDGPTNAELAAALATADDAVLAAIAALNNLSAAQVTAAVPTAVENADALLKRDFSAVTGEASRSALNALRFLRNKWSIAGGTLTVTKENDTTTAWTGAVTQTAGNPVSEIDPA